MARQAAELPVDAGAVIAATAALIGDAATKTARFGIAVSGGPDSLALLLLAHKAFAGRVYAATIDHQLRPESADEAKYVAKLCLEIDVPHTILTPREPIVGSLQASARAERYALLEVWRIDQQIDWLMTAHHADDQVETMVMRLNRGSGVAGLSAIRSKQGRVLRPLLGTRHGALVACVQSHGWAAIDDASNRDDRFDRARVRKQLSDSALLNAINVAASASALSDAEDALEWTVRAALNSRITGANGTFSIDVTDVPRELRRRLICVVLMQMEPGRQAPRGDVLTRAVAILEGAKAAMVGDTCISPDKSDANLWKLRAAPPRVTR